MGGTGWVEREGLMGVWDEVRFAIAGMDGDGSYLRVLSKQSINPRRDLVVPGHHYLKP